MTTTPSQFKRRALLKAATLTPIAGTATGSTPCLSSGMC